MLAVFSIPPTCDSLYSVFLSPSISVLHLLHPFCCHPLCPPPLCLEKACYTWRTRRARARDEARGIYYGAVAGLILRPAPSSKHAYSVCDVYTARVTRATFSRLCVPLSVCPCTRGGRGVLTRERVNGYYSRQMYYGRLNLTLSRG